MSDKEISESIPMSVSDLCREIIKICSFVYRNAEKQKLNRGSMDVVEIDRNLWHSISNNAVREGYSDIRSIIKDNSVFSMFNVYPGSRPKGTEIEYQAGKIKYFLGFDAFRPLDPSPNVSIIKVKNE